jgi:hypothetical protein
VSSSCNTGSFVTKIVPVNRRESGLHTRAKIIGIRGLSREICFSKTTYINYKKNKKKKQKKKKKKKAKSKAKSAQIKKINPNPHFS